jgi:hypothetical protein
MQKKSSTGAGTALSHMLLLRCGSCLELSLGLARHDHNANSNEIHLLKLWQYTCRAQAKQPASSYAHAALQPSGGQPGSNTNSGRTGPSRAVAHAGSDSDTMTGDGSAPSFVTGLAQRIEVYLYHRALKGEDVGFGHIFQASAVLSSAPVLDALVKIVHGSSSLVEALVQMSTMSLHSDAAATEPSESHIAHAISRFHRMRGSLDKASIAAVHALDSEHILLLQHVPSLSTIPLLVLYNWTQDSVRFVAPVMSVKVLVCAMW